MYRDKIYKCNSDKFRRTSHEILTFLSGKAMSKHELAIVMDLSLSSISNYMHFLKKQGLVYIAEWISNDKSKPTAKYRFGTNQDVEYVFRKKYRYKHKNKPIPNATNRCDIAASWIRG